jgi:hypothetical protein
VEFIWGEVKRQRQVLQAKRGTDLLGVLDLGVAEADDEDAPRVRLDYAKVEPEHQGGLVSVGLIRAVADRWPQCRVVAGPLSHDDPPGPRFRLRCWDEADVPVHEPGCVAETCRCRERIVVEVEKRLDEWHESGGITEEQLHAKKAALGLGQGT